MISYWHSYRSEVSGIGGSQNEFVMAQLQIQGQLHWPEPKRFHNGPVTGPRSVALARPEVFSYWPSYRYKVSCIGPSQMISVCPSYRSEVSSSGLTRSVLVLVQLHVRGQLHWPEPNYFVLAQLHFQGQQQWPNPKSFCIGPVTGTRPVALAGAK